MKLKLLLSTLLIFSIILSAFSQETQYDQGIITWELTASDSLNPTPFYDRFGNNIPRSVAYYNDESVSSKKTSLLNTKSGDTAIAGHFIVHFYENDTEGFLHPLKGDDRKNVLVNVLKDMSELIERTSVTDRCTGEINYVHIGINANLNFKEGVLGHATPTLSKSFSDSTIVENEIWKVLNTGHRSQSINSIDGYININFNNQFYTEVEPITSIGTRYDLYSVILHELTHAMGFVSFIGADGKSYFSKQPSKLNLFSRFDLLLRLNNQKIITNDNSISPFYHLYSNISSSQTTLGCNTTKIESNSCNFLDETLKIYAPDSFKLGASFSHFGCKGSTTEGVLMESTMAKGEMIRFPDEGTVKVLAELGYKITGVYGSNSSSINYKNDYGLLGESKGGVDDGIGCSGQPVYKITSCDNQTVTIPITQNDGAQPDSIVGLRMIDGPPMKDFKLLNGDIVQYKPKNGHDYIGYSMFEYIPFYGCIPGPAVKVWVYISPCDSLTLCYDSLPPCVINCNGDMERYWGSADTIPSTVSCQPIQIGFKHGLLNWVKLHKGPSPDYLAYENGNRGVWMYIDGSSTYHIEGVATHAKFEKSKSYEITISVRQHSDRGQENACDSIYPPKYGLDLVRFTGGQGEFFTSIGLDSNNFEWTENYLNSIGPTRVLLDVRSENLSYSEFKTYKFCYTPDIDLDYIAIYGKASGTFNGGFASIGEVSVKEIPSIVNDITTSCNNGPVEYQADFLCPYMGDFSLNWEDNQGNLLSENMNVTIPESGTYTLKLRNENGELCSQQSFEVNSLVDFTVASEVTHSNCSTLQKGSINITLENTNPNATYTFEWSNGATSEDLSELNPGAYSVIITDGTCSIKKDFVIEGAEIIDLSILTNTGEQTICIPDNLILSTASGQNASWFRNGLLISGGLSTSYIEISEGGVYEARPPRLGGVSVCYINGQVTIIESQKPTFPQDTYTVCQGEELEIDIQPKGFPNLLELVAPELNPLEYYDKIARKLKITPLNSNTYTFSNTGLNGTACYNSVTVNVTKVDTNVYPEMIKGFIVGSGETVDITEDTKVKGVIRVKTGGILNVTNCRVNFINDYEIIIADGYEKKQSISGIVIEEGGVLFAEDATFETPKNGVCTQNWDGIQVWGDDYRKNLTSGGIGLNPFPIVYDANPTPGTKNWYPAPTSNYFVKYIRHGLAYFTDCTIRFANEGISLYKRFQQPDDQWDYGEGRVYTGDDLNDASLSFVECNKAIVFEANSFLRPNYSIIDKIKAQTDECISSLPYGCDENNKVGVKMVNVHSVTIKDFEYNFANENATGFLLINSGLKLEEQSTGHVRSQRTGIHVDASSTGGLSSYLEVNMTDYNAVQYSKGVILKNMPYPVIRNFHFTETQFIKPEYGIFLQGTTGALITDNTFNVTSTNQGTPKDRAIIVEGSTGDLNEVYRNQMNKALYVGVQAQGANPQLWANCNEFKEPNQFDMAITGAGTTQGTLGNMGDCNGTAEEISANTFNSCSANNYGNIYWDLSGGANPSSNFLYSSYPILSPNCTSSNVNVINCPVGAGGYDPSQACPERQGFVVNWPPNILDGTITGIIEQVTKNDVVRNLLVSLTVDEVAEQLGVSTLGNLKTYIATMVDVRELEKARNKMNVFKTRDGLTDDDQNFIQLFELLIQLSENNTPWKFMQPDELEIVKNIAYSKGQSALAAQAVYSAVTDVRFIPNASPVELPTNPQPRQWNSGNLLAGFNNINMYPNPSNGLVTIQTQGDIELMTITVFDVAGKKVWEMNTSSNSSNVFDISLNQLNPGVYSVNFETRTGEKKSEQLVIQP